MYFNDEKEYCILCSDVIDAETYYTNEGYCDTCCLGIETCEDCGDHFHRDELIDGICEDCHDIYRDELNGY